MTQTLKEKKERLGRRKAAGYGGRIKGETPPGSMNDHKAASASGGHRSTTKVRSDSRTATS